MSEIFPSRIRELGIAVGTATQWLFNFVFSQVTPHALDNIKWRTFLMFAVSTTVLSLANTTNESRYSIGYSWSTYSYL